ncbi:MAG: AAA-like domain-containing protein [Candidatus Methylacidiphilales bacterium]|nr:AAA-like domain-containing protein [Candidatus Methylacidiphilales bacterium]
MNITLSLRAVFVFDNIDQYVDVYRAKAVEAMNLLIEGAAKNAGTSKYVFTCRPKLLYEQPTFLQLELHGLTVAEAQLLFAARGLTVEPKHINEVHDLTQGHPLWINLIAMQVLTNRVELVDLIRRIRAGKDAGLPNAMLQEIWRSLKPKHQKLLRYLAEMVRPETEREIAQCVALELNSNQFTKALRQLTALDLVVVKTPSSAPDTIELHPLLREFVRRQFSQSERSPYISAILLFFDQMIVKLRPTLGQDVSYEVLQNWTAKVELLINSGEVLKALLALEEIRKPLLRNGYAEEFVKWASALYANIDLSLPAGADQKIQDDVLIELVEALTQLGRFADAEEFIVRFERGVAGATARYVAACGMRTYMYWTRGEFELAKEWGKRGVEVKTAGNLDTRHDCEHNLALAQRDSGEVEQALIYFLGATSLEDVINPLVIDRERGGSFYGNIGRCLFFKGDNTWAETCLIKSAWCLEKAKDQLVLINQGWVAAWLGELFEKHNSDLAYIFYRRAALKWKLTSPQRFERAVASQQRLSNRVSVDYLELLDWQIDRKYCDWLNKARQFPAD